jgi:multidrug efflux system membrane fusion protein
VVDGLRVVREGLKPTEWIVIKGVQRTRPGVAVTPERKPLPGSTAFAAPPAEGAKVTP